MLLEASRPELDRKTDWFEGKLLEASVNHASLLKSRTEESLERKLMVELANRLQRA